MNRGARVLRPVHERLVGQRRVVSAYEMRSLAFDTVHHHLAGMFEDGVWMYAPVQQLLAPGRTREVGLSTSYVNRLATTRPAAARRCTDSDGVWCYDPSVTRGPTLAPSGNLRDHLPDLRRGQAHAGCDYDQPLTRETGVGHPASPGPYKWTDTGLAAPAVHDLVMMKARGLLDAGTGEKYTDSGGQGVWRARPPRDPGRADISAGDIGTYKTTSLGRGKTRSTREYATAAEYPACTRARRQYDLTNPSGGWTQHGGSMDGFEAYALAWDGGKLNASRVDPNEPVYDSGDGVWCYDPATRLLTSGRAREPAGEQHRIRPSPGTGRTTGSTRAAGTGSWGPGTVCGGMTPAPASGGTRRAT